MKNLGTALLVVGLASGLLAQNDDVLREKKLEFAADALKAADKLKARAVATRQTFDFVAGQLISGPPVKGAPYSAEAVNETIQTLADGNRIVQRSSAMQYRDAEGRERREETSAMGAIFITDPVAGTRYTLHPDSRTAEKGPAGLALRVASNGIGRGVVNIAINGEGHEESQRFITTVAGGLAAGSADVKTEQLGNMYIEGVQAQGTRVTTTIPAGEIGNDRPINIVDERWYSPDLQMTIMTKHSDPRSGETTYSLKNINRSSPPPTLFEIPSDYTVSAGGGGRSGPFGVAVPADAAQRDREEKLRKAGVLK